MGCVCLRNKGDKPIDSKISQGLNKEDFKVQKGQSEIVISIGDISKTQCDTIVSYTDNRGQGYGNVLFQNFKLPQIKQKQNFGDVIRVKLPIADKEQEALFIVLPIWTGLKRQQDQLALGLRNALQIISEKPSQTIAIEDIGVQNCGYPRQIVATTLVQLINLKLPELSLRKVEFISQDVFVKNLIESEIKKNKKIPDPILQVEDKQYSFEQDSAQIQKKSQSRNSENNNDLKQPLLSG